MNIRQLPPLLRLRAGRMAALVLAVFLATLSFSSAQSGPARAASLDYSPAAAPAMSSYLVQVAANQPHQLQTQSARVAQAPAPTKTPSKGATPKTPAPKGKPTHRAAATVPASTCSAVTSTSGTTRTCDLYALTGTYGLPNGTSVNIWGFSSSASGPAGLPGPVLVANAGETLTINLHNVNIPTATSLTLSQAPGAPDTTGVTAGNSTTYSFTNVQPGTYLYEAGLTGNGPRQVAMGLYGALVVRPTSCVNCAYDANSTFDDEAVLVLSEIDPSFNANPTGFYMPDFAPKYWLINGQAYPNTDTIATDVSHKVLLRYVNAGLNHHSMSLLGLHESIVGVDAKQAPNPMRVAAQTIPAGSSLDAITTIPTNAAPGSDFAIFEAAMHLDNGGALTTPSSPTSTIAAGGMLAYLQVAGAVSATAPVTSNVAVAPNPSDGSADVSLTAQASSTTSTISGMEYFTDATGTDGTGIAMSGTFGGATVTDAHATISAATLAGLASGNHTFYVHALDATGQWGAFVDAVLNLDKGGPQTSSLSVTPAITNGSVDVQLQATADDSATGGQTVIAGEYFIDPTGTPANGSGTSMTVSAPATAVSLTATIPAGTVLGLGNGVHTIAVRGEDALGNWGAFGYVNLTVETVGPAISGVTTTPNPTNGQSGVQGGTGGAYYQRIDAIATDTGANGASSNIIAAEYFIDTPGTNGSGGSMLPVYGAFTGPTAPVYALADLHGIQALSQGQHTIYVHAENAAGNWGAYGTTTLTIDKTGPTVSNASLSPNPNNGAASVTLTATATDPANNGTPANAPASNVVAGEWFIGTDPGVGQANRIAVGTPAPSVTLSATINITTFQVGTYTVSVRALDAAGNWGSVRTVTLTVNQRSDALFADGFDAGNFSAWSSTGGTAGRITATAAAAQGGTAYGMAATVSGGTSGYVQDNTPAAETTYRARFYINPNNATVTATAMPIFVGLTGANGNVFTVQLRRQNNGTYQVSAVVSRSGGTTATSWYTISGNTFTAIEISWQSGGSASFSLYTGGTLRQTLTGLNTSALTLETVRLGPQGGLANVTGTLYFDSFVSRRSTFIGL